MHSFYLLYPVILRIFLSFYVYFYYYFNNILKYVHGSHSPFVTGNVYILKITADFG